MRRESSPFNLSLLDLLTAALGAVIFLFVITPKGGASASKYQQAAIFFDTATMQIHGVLPDSLRDKRRGDTLFAMLVDYRAVKGPDVGGLEAELAAQRSRAAQAVAAAKEAEADRQAALAASRDAKTASERARAEKQLAEAERKQAEADRRAAEAKAQQQAQALAAARANQQSTPAPLTKQPNNPPTKQPTTPTEQPYRGTLPSVPARVSFELKWANAADNVDLFVCQGNDCVFGNNKRDKNIGDWDSGKSRNRLFGNDLRTNQEAVRQFDRINPGTYTVYAVFKESDKGTAVGEYATPRLHQGRRRQAPRRDHPHDPAHQRQPHAPRYGDYCGRRQLHDAIRSIVEF